MVNKSKSNSKANKHTRKVKKPNRNLILVISDAPIRKTKKKPRKPKKPRNRRPRKTKRSKNK